MRRRRSRNRSDKKFNLNPKFLFGFLTVICLVLIFCSYRYESYFAPVKTAFGDFVAPMQRGMVTVGDGISGWFKKFSRIDELLKENEKLTEMVEELKNENRLLVQEQYELSLYMELYNVDLAYDQYEKVAAKVISREPNSYCNEFIIDKGSSDGLKKDMNVIANDGLVGIITETGNKWSRVRSIIDDNSRVSGMFLKTSDTCIVSGNLELIDYGYIDVNMINMNAEVYDNYEVVTSYISDKYMPGILIGYVSNIQPDSSSMSKEAYLTPVVDFSHLETVLVITQLRESYDDLDEVLSSDN